MLHARAVAPQLIDPRELSAGLGEAEAGLFVPHARVGAPIAFPQAGHDGCFELEERSFWFSHRNRVLLDALSRHPYAGVLADVGGGNGFVTAALREAGHAAVLVEPGAAGVRNALARGVAPVLHGTLEELALHEGALGAVGLFDVLEHVADVHRLLGECRRVLRADGRLYVTVPAHRVLWSHADSSAQHVRRYERGSLRRDLESAGFELQELSFFFAFLTAPVFALRAVPDWFRAAPADLQAQAVAEHAPSGLASRVVEALGAAERRALRAGYSAPTGTSLLAVCRRR